MQVVVWRSLVRRTAVGRAVSRRQTAVGQQRQANSEDDELVATAAFRPAAFVRVLLRLRVRPDNFIAGRAYSAWAIVFVVLVIDRM